MNNLLNQRTITTSSLIWALVAFLALPSGVGLIFHGELSAQIVRSWEGDNAGTGGNNNIYGRKQNWSSNNAPNSTGEVAFFDNTINGNITIATNNQNAGGGPPWTINGVRIDTGGSPTVTFNSAGDFHFGGTNPALDLRGDNSSTFFNDLRWNSAGSIEHSSTGILTLDGDTTLNADLDVNHSGTGDIDFNANISGSGGMTINGGTGDIDFSYGVDRTFTGGMVINDGVVSAFDSIDDGDHIIIGDGFDEDTGFHMLGSGDVTLNGGTLEITTENDHIAVNNDSFLTVNGGTLNITTLAPNTGNDFRLNYGTYIQTGGESNFDLGDDFNMYEGSGGDANEAGQAFISGGTFNAIVRDQFRSYQSNGQGKVATFSVTDGAVANITLNGERGTSGSGNGVVAANYDGSDWIFDGCGTAVNFSATSMAATTPHMVNLAGNTSITDGAIVSSTIDVVLNRTANFSGDNSANMSCPTGPGELQLNGSANLFVNQSPNLSAAPNIAFDSASDQSIFSVTNNAAPTTSSGSYQIPSNNIGGSGELDGVGTLRKSGSGTLTIDGSMGAGSITADEIDIQGGTLLLGGDNQFASSTDVILGGATFATGGNDASLGTLTLTADSIIDMGNDPAGSILQFADSSGVTWDPGATLTVTNWDGIFKDGNGIDQLFFGTDGSGLTSQQRSQIVFAAYPGSPVAQLPDGEVVPVPEPAAYAAMFGLAILIGWRERSRLMFIRKTVRDLFKA